MLFYQVTGDGFESEHVASLGEARAMCEHDQEAHRESYEVQELQVPITAASVLALLNRTHGVPTFTGRTWRGKVSGGLTETTVPTN